MQKQLALKTAWETSRKLMHELLSENITGMCSTSESKWDGVWRMGLPPHEPQQWVGSHILICRIAPYFPKISYISSEVMLNGRFLKGWQRWQKTRFDETCDKSLKPEERRWGSNQDDGKAGSEQIRDKNECIKASRNPDVLEIPCWREARDTVKDLVREIDISIEPSLTARI